MGKERFNGDRAVRAGEDPKTESAHSSFWLDHTEDDTDQQINDNLYIYSGTFHC